MCKEIFRVQAQRARAVFDEMINTFDPDALIVGGGVLETSPEFQQWFSGRNPRRDAEPARGAGDIPIHVIAQWAIRPGREARPLEALKLARPKPGLA